MTTAQSTSGEPDRLPCPFCASINTGVYATTRHVEQAWYHVSCEDCQAAGPWRTDRAAAVRGWDARAAEAVASVRRQQDGGW